MHVSKYRYAITIEFRGMTVKGMNEAYNLIFIENRIFSLKVFERWYALKVLVK